MINFTAVRALVCAAVAGAGVLCAQTQALQEFSVSQYAAPQNYTAGANRLMKGPDGNIWFTYSYTINSVLFGAIGQMSPAGAVLATVQTTGIPSALTSGPAGDLSSIWFIESINGVWEVGRISAGANPTLTLEAPIPNQQLNVSNAATPNAITNAAAANDSGIYFTDTSNAVLWRVTPTSPTAATFSTITIDGPAHGLALGPDNNLWFTEYVIGGGGYIAYVTPPSSVTTKFAASSNIPPSTFDAITTGPDLASVWFTQNGSLVYSISTTAAANSTPTFEYAPSDSTINDMTLGPDRAIWYTQTFNPSGTPIPPALGRIALSNGTVAESDQTVNTQTATFGQPYGIAVGPNNNDLWFNDSQVAFLGDAVIIPPLTITPVALPNAPYGQSYSTNLVAGTVSGGTSPYSFQVATSSSLPAGLTLNPSSGVISGTPTGALVATSFNVTVTDNNAPFAQTATSAQQFSITVTVGPPASITATSGGGQSAQVNTSFSSPFVATVTDSGGNPVPGASVTFASLGGSGASGTFTGSATVLTNASGVATSPTFTANAIAGGPYNVSASVNGVSVSALFSVTNLAGPAASVTATAGSGQSAQVNTAFSTPLAATVRDASGNAVSGVSVTFSAPGSGASGTFGGNATVVTNASGVAVAPAFTANSVTGGYSVTASVNGVSPSASFALTNTAGAAATITPTSGGGQNAQVLNPFGSPLVATVKDANGNLVPNVSVLFVAPGSGPSGTFAGSGASVSVQTNSSGVAQSPTFTANSVAGGPYNVTASVNGVSASYSLTNNAGPPATVTATSGGGQSAQVNHAFGNPLVATVKDAAGNLLSGVSVLFVAPGSGASGTFAGSGISVSVQTNASGVATSPVFTANAVAGGPYNVSASVNGASASYSLTNNAGPPATVTPASGGGQSAQVNTQFNNPLVATVKDASGNPVSGATVRFSAPASGASGTFGENGATVTVQTNSSGVATSPAFYANATAGNYTVTASVNGISASYALANTSGPPGSITATSGGNQSAQVNHPFAHQLTATVKDANGNAVSGASVTFSAPATSGASGTFAGSATVQTNSSGVAFAPVFTADAKAGSYTVTASTADVSSPATFALTNTAGAPSSITATSGGGQSVKVGAAFSLRLVAAVKDASGNAISGVSVTFSAPASGASGTFTGDGATATVTTDGSGLATSPTFTANATAGAYSVTASTANVSGQATFALANTAGSASSIMVTSGGGQSVKVGAPFAPLVATVKDSGGNGIAGISVVFSAPASGASGTFAGGGATATVATNTSGIATSPVFTANAMAGPYTVSAKATGLSASASFALTNVPNFTFTGLPATGTPGSSITNATITVSPATAADLPGTLSLALSGTPSEFPANNHGDAGFGTGFGSKTWTYAVTVPAGKTTVPFPSALDPGTVAGNLAVTLTVNGQTAETPVTIGSVAPIIEAGSVQITNITSTGFDVELVATSTTLELKTATFTFTAAAGAQISGSATFTADVSSLLAPWFASSNYQYGGAFSLSIPFTISGPSSAIGSVSVTLTNSSGTSSAVSGTP